MNKALLFKYGGYFALAVGIYLFIIRPILEKVGVIETPEDLQLDKEKANFATGEKSPFNPLYFKGVYMAKLYPKAYALQLAEKFDDAIGTFSDDELAVFALLKSIEYKTQLSWVSAVFTEKYGRDLYIMLKRNMSDDDLLTVHQIVNAMK